MTDTQIQILENLIELIEECGRGYFPLSIIGAPYNLSEKELYDNDTNTGILWEFDPRSGTPRSGWLHFIHGRNESTSVTINIDVQRMIERAIINHTANTLDEIEKNK